MTLTISPAVQRVVALGLAALALLAVLFAAVLPIWDAVSVHEERVAMLRAQTRKLEALAAAGPRYDALAGEISAKPEFAALTFADAEPRVAVADLQTRAVHLFTAAGGVVARGEAVPLAEYSSRIAVRLTLQTTIAALVRALHAVAVARPLLRVEQLSVREPDGAFASLAASVPNIPNELTVEVTVSAELRRW